jgi:hypothetical protein
MLIIRTESKEEWIREMDINPLIVHEKGKGAMVTDCRIILEAVNATK